MGYERIRYERDGTVARIVLHHPENRNALSQPLLDEFQDAISEVRRRSAEIGVLVITGTGKSFSSGADVKEMGAQQSLGPVERQQAIETFYRKALCFLDLPMPVLASINGHAIGAGLSLALACDLRIASLDARLGLGFVRIGLTPGGGTTYFLPRLVGSAKALELLVTGEVIHAEEAVRIGLVNRAVPGDRLEDATRDLARKIADGPPVPVRWLKRAIGRVERKDLEAALADESMAQTLCTQTEDMMEGVTAFLERREPRFKGR